MLKIIIPVLLLSSSCFSHAALTVVADLGGDSTLPLFEAVVPEMDTSASSPVQSAPVPLNKAVFPVISSRLHPGTVSSRPLKLSGMTPIFLAGDDPLSVLWLQEKKKTLKSLNATGLVISVASQERFEFLQQQAEDLTLYPVSGDDLAQRLQLDTYPVLITESGLTQ